MAARCGFYCRATDFSAAAAVYFTVSTPATTSAVTGVVPCDSQVFRLKVATSGRGESLKIAKGEWLSGDANFGFVIEAENVRCAFTHHASGLIGFHKHGRRFVNTDHVDFFRPTVL